MSTQDHIRKELDRLGAEFESTIKLAASTSTIVEFGTEYQSWYTRALRLVQTLAPDRLREFVSYYERDPKRKALSFSSYTIQDYIMGVGPRKDIYDKPLWDASQTASWRFANQVQILRSLRERIDSVLSDVEGSLLAEVEDRELESACRLLKVNIRAAGTLAGVVLERHLQHVAAIHIVAINSKTPTIADLNEPLKKAGVYAVATWRKIQFLADIRNLCSHNKGTEPTAEQVKELIAGVSEVVKTIQ